MKEKYNFCENVPEMQVEMKGYGVGRTDEYEDPEEKNAFLSPEAKGDYGEDDVTTRDVWSRKIEYLLSLIGFTVGLGSIWRFPYLCMKNGGGAFLIPFIFFMITSGIPLYFLELAIGQFSGRSPLIVWSICPMFEGLGFSMVMLSFICTWIYGMIMGWINLFFVYSFFPKQPWSTCDNEWNTPGCQVVRDGEAFVNVTVNVPFNETGVAFLLQNQSFPAQTAAFEFWRFKLLNVSSGITDVGPIQWHLVLAEMSAFALCFLCIIKGVKSVGKVVYITATLPYLLLTVIFIRAMTLEGSVNGVIKFLKPDFTKLWEYNVWLEAAVQVFYSLGPAYGGVITMASFSKFRNKCWNDAVLLVFMDTISAFYAGLVVFAINGFLAHEAGMEIEEVAESGPGLVFIAYPEALARLPLPQLWSVLFFLMLIMVGLDSMFGMLETIIGGFVDFYPRFFMTKRKYILVAAVFTFYVISALIFTTRGAVYVYQVVDWYATSFCIFSTTVVECIVIGWIYGAERFSRDMEIMLGIKLFLPLRFMWCIVTPFFMVVAFISVLVGFKPPVYKGYVYPPYIGTVGIIIGLVPVAPTFLWIFVNFLKAEGPFIKRIRDISKPRNWMPNDPEEAKNYKLFKYGGTFWQNVKLDLTGR